MPDVCNIRLYITYVKLLYTEVCEEATLPELNTVIVTVPLSSRWPIVFSIGASAMSEDQIKKNLTRGQLPTLLLCFCPALLIWQ